MSSFNRDRELWLFFELYAPSGSTVRCVLFRTDAGLELRLQTWNLPAERVQRVQSYGAARALATEWRHELIEQHHFRGL
jgi:hypothetical protein